jgi:hypothetical protein
MILAAVLFAGFAAAALVADPIEQFPIVAAGTALATVGWLLLSSKLLGMEPGGMAPSRSLAAFAILVAFGARALWLVPAAPLSDDLHRYLWDGRVANAGINPYEHPPNAPELDALRGETAPRVNHPDIPTIYPPVAQLAFRALDLAGLGPRGVRAWAAACDLGAALVFALALRRAGRPPALALVHATCPLAVLESAGGGHVDAFGVLLLSAAVLLAGRAASAARACAAGLFFGGAVLVKLVPAALAPALFARRPARESLALGAGAALAALAVVPYLAAGEKLLSGLGAYARHWHFHDFAYSLMTRSGVDPLDARRLLAGAFALVALAVPAFVKDRAASIGVVFAAFLVLSPTVHPWYALWLVPFLVSLPRAIRPAGFALVALLPFSYVTAWRERATGVWEEPGWSAALTWGGAIVFLTIGILRERARRSRA